jgi:FAD/FMN-containing dehydrogenase
VSAHVLGGDEAVGFLTDQHRRLNGRALAVVRPADTEQVAQVVRLCREHRTPIVPQGGNTGLMGAATPDDSGRAVLLSLGRLNRIRAIDTDNDTLTAEAGCVLANVQQAALDADRLFPLSLGSEGSCTIGGNLGTNAGGTQVLRYGNARELTLGLEVVTAEGEIWNALRGLRKDNTGYALRDLYIGSEGTLGIITAATLKLYPLPVAQHTALLAFSCIRNAIAFLSKARAGFGAGLTAFELMSDTALGLIAQHVPEQPIPLEALASPWYALIELSDSEGEDHARARFEAVIGTAFEDGLVTDATIAQSLQQSQALWRLRDEALGEAQRRDGRNIKHDISVPISRIPEFLSRYGRRAAGAFSRRAAGGLRAPRRRQPSLQRLACARPEFGLCLRSGRRDPRGGARQRACAWRVDQRRARHRPDQARCAPALQERGRTRPDAPRQAGPRSIGPAQPRQGAAAISLTGPP